MPRHPPSIDEALAQAYSTFAEGNHEGAVSIFRRLADDGVAEAEHFMGWCHEQGVCVPKDVEKALFWWKRAAAAGIPEAIEALRSYESRGANEA